MRNKNLLKEFIKYISFISCPFVGFNIIASTCFASTENPKPANIILYCPRLCRQYKKTLVDVENKIVKQQTDFVFQTESVLF